MRYLSLFSGIEAATQAWAPLGWECVAVSEIEPFPCAVLAHHYPDVPNLGDVTKITEQQIKNLGQIDLVVFGSPCQNLSVAGNRMGLAGEQSSLFYAAMEIISYARKHCNTRFALWENVPGAFSSNKGADFAAVVSHMAGLNDLDIPKHGWGREGAAVGDNGLLEWAVLDAQFFGLAQRRKRVFAVIDFGEWASRPPILLERESLRGDSAPSRETRQSVAANAQRRLGIKGFAKQRIGEYKDGEIASTCAARDYKDATDLIVCHGSQDPICNSHVANALGRNSGQENVIAIAGNIIGRTEGNGGNGNGFDASGACYTLTATDRHGVAYGCSPTALDVAKVNAITASYGQGGADLETKPLVLIPQKANAHSFDSANMSLSLNEEVAATLCAHNAKQPQAVFQPPSVVRRLTPMECERLQGFPDGFTKIPYRGKPASDCPDSPRYKALGNSMAVNVMAWIGQRIQQAVAISCKKEKVL